MEDTYIVNITHAYGSNEQMKSSSGCSKDEECTEFEKTRKKFGILLLIRRKREEILYLLQNWHSA
jgi:hypothetical protein